MERRIIPVGPFAANCVVLWNGDGACWIVGQKEGNVVEEEADAAGCVAGRGENAGGEAGGG